VVAQAVIMVAVAKTLVAHQPIIMAEQVVTMVEARAEHKVLARQDKLPAALLELFGDQVVTSLPTQLKYNILTIFHIVCTINI
jgi:hypothetical protein